MNRRTFLKQMITVVSFSIPLVSACAGLPTVTVDDASQAAPSANGVAEAATDGGTTVPTLVKTPEEWRKILPANAYAVLFEESTEAPFSSPLNDEHREGTFICAACNLPLFSSATKFDSGTGWPSFYEALPDSVGTRDDFSLMMARTEYHCVRCGGHQGHLFNDGPAPTGMRYCNNGLALAFVPQDQSLPELRS